ncbi:MAG: signal recognition particle protein [Gammaproteobacteria bacterium]|nr:signal recognition particle protein [Gammaproteobacteria bacterium]
MFDNLSDRLTKVLKDLRGHGRLNEDNISEALREVRMALLEADVALPVVKEFIEHVKSKAISQEVMSSLTPGQAVIKIVNDELVQMMGESNVSLNMNTQPPAVILMAGLQGAGKTTTVGKLGRWLKEKQKKKVMTVSCDIYRPAAIEQLRVLASDNQLEFFESTVEQDPVDIARAAIKQASAQFMDVLIVDTAGRLHVDGGMMDEVKSLHSAINPSDTIFVIDSMLGQDAVNSAQAFNTTLPLTGVILTKTDGDARGGAALSVRQVTGKPILFIGTGEKSDELSPFHPDRVASRILGMGDVLSLIEEVEEKADKEKAEKLAKKLKKGKGFTLTDFNDQLDQMKNMGGMGGLLDKLPGAGQIPQAALNQVDDKQMGKLQAIISSMTLDERKRPALINGSRKKRIANGSGTQIQDVNRLLKQFNQMQKMMKKMSKKGGMQKMMRGLGGNLPPGFRP